jgi:hypothetical protein
VKYRKLDANGDYVFGHSQEDFLINSPEAVAQAVKTRLGLWLGEWFADTSDGTNWVTGVLGKYTYTLRDNILRTRIATTPGVRNVVSFSSTFDPNTRKYIVNTTIDTIYGIMTLQTSK